MMRDSRDSRGRQVRKASRVLSWCYHDSSGLLQAKVIQLALQQDLVLAGCFALMPAVHLFVDICLT
jgi:hypothetical protein